MSRLVRLLAAPLRLPLAIRRYGVGSVASFGVDMIRRYGVRQVVAYAIAPGEARRDRLVQMRRAEASRALDQRMRKVAAARRLGVERTRSVPAKRWAVQAAAMAKDSLRRFPPNTTPEGAAVHIVVADAAVGRPPAAADDDWVVMLKPGDQPSTALAARVAAAGTPCEIDIVSFDMTLDAGAHEVLPLLHTGADPLLARTSDVGLGRYAIRARLLAEGALNDPYGVVRAFARSLPAVQASERWRHLAEPLAAAAADAAALDRARAHARAAAWGEIGAPQRERVSAVICTHSRGRLVRRLVHSLNDPRIDQTVVVANNVTSRATREALDDLGGGERLRVLMHDEPFNFSRLCNIGAAATQGDRLLFLNDDVAPLTETWLDALLQPFTDPEVGITGPLLFYSDETVQHAGMYLGFRGNAGHLLRGVRLPENEVGFYTTAPRQVSAVTGAVMMVERGLFDALNGFDESLPTFLQDVDLCLRARAVGRATVFTPLAELLHFESTTIRNHLSGLSDRQRHRELERFMERWPGCHEDFHNPAFNPDDEALWTLSQD